MKSLPFLFLCPEGLAEIFVSLSIEQTQLMTTRVFTSVLSSFLSGTNTSLWDGEGETI